MDGVNSYHVLYSCYESLAFVYTDLVLFTTNKNRENVYCEYRGHNLRFLKSSLQEPLVLEFVIILIILFES
jgi:hypothetical protein